MNFKDWLQDFMLTWNLGSKVQRLYRYRWRMLMGSFALFAGVLLLASHLPWVLYLAGLVASLGGLVATVLVWVYPNNTRRVARKFDEDPMRAFEDDQDW